METAPQFSRFLIVRLSALGDVVHGLPLLSALRAAYPKAHIGWIVEDRAAALLDGHPQLDALHIVPRKAWRESAMGTLLGPMRGLAREVRAQHYEVAIDMQGLTKSAIWTRVSRAGVRLGFTRLEAREMSWMFYNALVEPPDEAVHVVQKNLSLLRPLGIENPKTEFHVHLPEAARERARAIWGTLDDRYPRVVMNPGAGWKTKRWPAASYGRLALELVKEVEARVAIAWGPGEQPLAREALAAYGEAITAVGPETPGSVKNAPGIYSLPATSFVELGAVLDQAHLYIGGDTGPSHLAAALGTPTLGLFGASDARRNGPMGPRAESIQLTEPACIPCWAKECSHDEPLACLTHIRIDRVQEACLKMLGSQKR